jgi:hypothetical protein
VRRWPPVRASCPGEEAGASCGRSTVADPLAAPPFPVDDDAGAPEDEAPERIDVAFFGADRELRAPPDARGTVDAVRLDDEDLLDLVPEARFAVAFLPVLLLELLFAVLLAALFLPVLEVLLAVLLFAVVLLLELLFAVLLEPLFAVLRFAVLLEPLFAVLRFAVLLEPLFAVVLLLELLFAVLLERLFAVVLLLELRFAVLLEPLFAVLLFAVLFLPVLVLLAPPRFFAPLRFRGEPAPRPSDSASMSSSLRIREAPLIPARVARLRSSTTVMSSMLRATSAPSPMSP